jgi:O-antigen/teichoic acid export membrane protein
MTTADTSTLDPSERAAPPSDGPALLRRVAGSASNLAVRRFVLMLLSAVTAAIVTRVLGPSGYGQYSAAIATWTLVGSAVDFGFSLALARDLPHDPGARRSMLRAAYQIALAWSIPLTIALVGMAIAAGTDTDRGLAMLLLAPSLITYGLFPARTIFVVLYRTRQVVIVDVAVGIVQSAGMIGVAELGLGAPGVAGVVSATTALNSILIWVLAGRQHEPGSSAPYGLRRFARRAAPLGIVSIMTTIYLLIDIVIIGWYITGPTVGEYAAAAKLLTILTGVTGLVTTAALPALSTHAADRVALGELVARVWHWLAVAALPLFVGLGLFAGLAVKVAAGTGYDGAIPLLRILSVAGILMVVNNLLGAVMVATRATRSIFFQNLVAIALNVAGNVLLLPSQGVRAAAWLTVATELLITVAALTVIRHSTRLDEALGISVRPVLAIVLGAVPGVLLFDHEILAPLASAVVFIAAMSLLRAWPDEFRVPGFLRRAARA